MFGMTGKLQNGILTHTHQRSKQNVLICLIPTAVLTVGLDLVAILVRTLAFNSQYI